MALKLLLEKYELLEKAFVLNVRGLFYTFKRGFTTSHFVCDLTMYEVKIQVAVLNVHHN